IAETVASSFPLHLEPQFDQPAALASHLPFALGALVFGGGGPAASLASRSAFRRSRLLENAFCAISCSVIAFLASTWRNALRASRSALVGVFVISSPSAPALQAGGWLRAISVGAVPGQWWLSHWGACVADGG